MIAVLGATGQVGRAVARALLDNGDSVRLVVRDPARIEPALSSAVSSIGIADFDNEAALAEAFLGTQSVFVLNPPSYASADMFADAQRLMSTIVRAARRVKVPRLVALSSVGAHRRERQGNIGTTTILEDILGGSAIPTTFVRAAWFVENWVGSLSVARDHGALPSFLLPLDRVIPMVGTTDVGKVCAQILREDWASTRIIELEGPRPCSPDGVAAAAERLLGRPVTAVASEREKWPSIFRSFGFSETAVSAWVEMLDGFNQGWLDFEGGGHQRVLGVQTLEETLRGLVPKPGSISQ